MACEAARTLGDIVSLVRGTTYKSALLGQPGPYLLGLASIQRNGGFRSDSLKTYGGESKEKLLLRPGDIFVSLKDVTQAADLLGAVARVPEGVELGRLTQDTVKLDFRDDSYPSGLVYWTLRSPDFRSYCRAHATGTTNLGLPREDFLAYPLPEPSDEVISLVELLEAIESRITSLATTNTTLEAIAQALFKSWFVDFDPVRARAEGREPEGMDAATAALFPSEFEESELGLIPKGWRTQSTYEMAQFINGAAYKAFNPNAERRGLPIIKIAELKSGVTNQTAFSDEQMAPKYRIDSGDILFSWSGNPDTSIDTFVWSRGPALLNQHIFRVVPTCQLDRSRILAMLKFLRPRFAEAARNKQTTGLGHVTVADLKEMRVVLPPPEVVASWNRIVDPIVEKALSTQLRAQLIEDLRDTLLPRLISGKLRLSEAETTIEEAIA